jgi:ubiquinone/menaquinone biosynthesis C-methylase UbiE
VSLVLCSVSDAGAALAELHRVIRPGGELRFLEHVRADSPSLRRIQRLMDASVWPRLTGGCHASRDSATAIQTAGFSIERLHSFRFPETRIPFPTAPHIVGVARRT